MRFNKASPKVRTYDTRDLDTTKWLYETGVVEKPRAPQGLKGTTVSQVRDTQVERPRRVLDLFCGTGSVGRVFAEMGYEVVSLDKDPRHTPTFCVDILDWDYRAHLTPGQFEVVTASPPCTEFSTAKTTGLRNLRLANRIVKRTLEIITFLKPTRWWLENPRYGLLRKQRYMRKIPFVDVDYCQYSDSGYKKPTRFWGSRDLPLRHLRLCDKTSCENVDPLTGRHFVQLSGKHQSLPTHLKYRIPERLVRVLAEPWVEAPHVTIPASCMEVTHLKVGRVTGEEGKKQLVVWVQAHRPDGTCFRLKALVDTGAETNLLRSDLLPPGVMKPSPHPLALVTANGTRMGGGSKGDHFGLCFATNTPNAQGVYTWCTTGSFHDAYI